MTQRVVAGDSPDLESPDVKSSQPAEALSGKLKFQELEDKLMHSVVENDQEVIEEGKMIASAMNMSMSSFTPSGMFEQLVKDFQMAKHIYGESLIRELTGSDTSEVEKNIRIPEYQRELLKKLSDRFSSMRDKKLLDKSYNITLKGIELASLVMYVEELDRLSARGLGEKVNKKASIYGEKQDSRQYKNGDRYKDLAVRRTVKAAIRRGHKNLIKEDLRVFDRESKGKIHIIYALDASGSMKGKKIESCKKAGIALAYRAIEEKDLVGLIVFGKDIEKAVLPTDDFSYLLGEIATLRASQETDISKTIRKAIEMFESDEVTRHLMILTDALPTAGEMPEAETLEAAEDAARLGITISVIGINLDDKGEELAQRIVDVGRGKLYAARNSDDIDTIVIEDYYSL